MKTKKYELVAEKSIEYFGLKLFRIRALISFGVVSAGEEGGFVESEKNVDQSGNAWVYGDARVSGNAQVSGNAWVYGNAWVSGNAQLLWITKVGGELGTLTAFRNSTGGILVTRGYFIGTLDDFRAAVIKKHGGTLHEKGYLGLANYIEWHFAELHHLGGDKGATP